MLTLNIFLHLLLVFLLFLLLNRYCLLGLSGILAALLENKNFTMCFSKILSTFQPIQDHSPFHTETNQFDL